MIFSSRLKLRGPDKSTVTDGPMIQDHAEAEQYGHQGLRKLPRLRLGRHALYYPVFKSDILIWPSATLTDMWQINASF